MVKEGDLFLILDVPSIPDDMKEYVGKVVKAGHLDEDVEKAVKGKQKLAEDDPDGEYMLAIPISSLEGKVLTGMYYWASKRELIELLPVVSNED